MIVPGDYVTTRLKFTGHFTGTFGTVHGKDQTVQLSSPPTLVRVENGRIVDKSRHIEDNSTLLQQMDIAKVIAAA